MSDNDWFSDSSKGGDPVNQWEDLVSDSSSLMTEVNRTVMALKADNEELSEEAIVGRIADVYGVDEREVRIRIDDAFEEIRSSSGQRRKAAERGGDSKRLLKLDAEQQDSLPMIGEIIDNIFDNYEKNIGEYTEHLEIEMQFIPNSKAPSVHSYIRIRENSGGIDEDSAENLWQSKGSPKEREVGSIGRFNRGLKLALPHFGLWHEVKTWELGFDEVSSDNHTGLKWQTGSASEASGDDVLSEEVDDYWADENQWWGTPRSTYLAEKDKTWVTQKKGRTEFKIRRLTDKGMKMVNDSDMFEQLVEFIRVVWSRLILRKLLGKHGRNVTITLKHPAREFEELIISTIEGLGEDFIDWTSDEFIGENFLQIPGVSPKIFTHDITTPDGVLKVTWITGVQKAFATRFPDDRMYDLLYYDDDPYPGFYFFGNGRLFHRAYQPDLTGAWDTKQKLPRSGREATQRKIDLGKGQNAYFVAMVMFDGPAVAIPFSGPVKWSVDKNHPYYGTAIDIAVRLGREGNSIMALVQELGASDEFRQGFQTADSAEEGGGDGADDNDGGGEKE